MKKFLIAAAAAVMPVFLWAAVQDSAGVIFPELEIGAGARAAGMSEAYTAVVNDAGAAYWNAGALGQIKNVQVSLAYDRWFVDTAYQRLMAAVPAGPGVFGADISYMNYGSFERVDNLGGTYGGAINPYYLGAVLAYGFPLGSGFYLGAGAKFITNSLDNSSNTGFAGDIGLQYVSGILSLGLTGQNIGAAGVYSLPLSIKTGAAVKIINNRDHNFMASVEGKYTLKEIPSVAAGAEYVLSGILAIRGGYKFMLGEDTLTGLKGFSAGAGIKLGNFGIDYAFVPHGSLGITHRVSAAYIFGGQPAVLSTAQLDEMMAKAGAVEDAGKLSEAELKYIDIMQINTGYAPAYKRLGSVYFKQGRKAEAIKTFESYLKLMPNDAAVKKWMLNNTKTKAQLDAMMLKAGAVEDTGKLNEAEIQYNVIKGYDENYAPVYKRLGAVYFKQGKKAQAIKTFEKYLLLMPGDAAVMKWLEKNR
ncbi:MAG: hypothetical protein CVV21_09915 [Candidatus Goldiibacteriota bacterium HGW-Goldbacteria-1]|jgi:hypothetical protein|nr:MAG: hypothetical protein CVV21_09915 [Candidatus Goldiibacteriota bacterium HGW-Goldbacteria-1]